MATSGQKCKLCGINHDKKERTTVERPELNLDRTKKALARYELRTRRAEWRLSKADTDLKVAVWQVSQLRAENEVRYAFFLDTRDLNSLSNCMSLTLNFIKHLIENEWRD